MKSLSTSLPITVVILTHNEESNLVACLRSCAWCNDVHVLDSGSTDGTIATAQARNIPVHHHPFTSFGTQRNWAIDHIPTVHPWQFHLDADERFTPSLLREIGRELGSDGKGSAKAAYYVPSKTIFMGRWLRHSAGYPTYQVRLFHRERCRFVDFGHGQREETQGEIGTLEEPYLHFNFSKGIAEWFAKHNRYSSLEAEEGVIRRHEGINWRALRQGGITRKRALKNLFYQLPARALWRFLYTYIARGGWRDGTPGLNYCLMISFYEYLIELKIREIELTQKS